MEQCKTAQTEFDANHVLTVFLQIFQYLWNLMPKYYIFPLEVWWQRKEQDEQMFHLSGKVLKMSFERHKKNGARIKHRFYISINKQRNATI